MSFFKKELNMVEKVAGLGPRLRQKVENVEKVSDHLPQHPMLQLSGPFTESKRDHLERYEEVHPFEKSESWMFPTVDEMIPKIKKYARKHDLDPPSEEEFKNMGLDALKEEMKLLEARVAYKKKCKSKCSQVEFAAEMKKINGMDKETLKLATKALKKKK